MRDFTLCLRGGMVVMHPVAKFILVVVFALCLMAGCGCTDGRIENAADYTVKGKGL